MDKFAVRHGATEINFLGMSVLLPLTVNLKKVAEKLMAERLERTPYLISINLLVVYRESVNLIGYLTRRLSADGLQL